MGLSSGAKLNKFDVEKLTSAMPESSMAAMTSNVINPCVNFFQGKATSSFFEIKDLAEKVTKNVEDVFSGEVFEDGIGGMLDKIPKYSLPVLDMTNTALNTVAGAAGNIYGNALGTIDNVIGDIQWVKDLVMVVTTDLIADIENLALQKLDSLLTPPSLSDFVGRATSFIPDYLTDESAALIAVLTSAESQNDLIETALQMASITSVVDMINSKVNDILKKIDEFVKKINDTITEITNYVTEGIQYMCDQINQTSEDIYKTCEVFINSQTMKLEQAKQNMIDSAARGIAKYMAELINSKIEKALFDAQIEINTFTAETSQKVKAKADTAIQKLKGMMGL